MQRMLLVLGRSAAAEASLETLLEEQQDKSSPSFHKWLTPDEFGEQFGISDQDTQTIIAWLEGHGFQVTGVSNGRGVIEFSGTANEVQQAFHTAIHNYVVNGKQFWANASDPEIPSALATAVIGIDSLNNFQKKAAHHMAGITAREMAGEWTKSQPALTYQCGYNPNTGALIYCNALGPYDFAAIYNVLPLWTATPATDGTGESIAIVGRSNINLQDVSDFQSLFGLANKPPKVILNGPDPGLVPGDETEADLDVEWSGGVAKGATVLLVVSESTETTDGVDLSAEYAVDNNIAPIMSESFGSCELDMGTAGNQFYKNLWEQAAAQGISVFVSTGDQGSAGCDFFQGNTPQPAKEGLQVSGIASTPYDVGVGGTDFNDFFSELTYWNTTNNPTTQQSAKGYIPETTWNDSCTNGIFSQIGFSTNAEANCNNYQLSGVVLAIGGSGGMSGCTTPGGLSPATCAGGYSKPPWQTASGVPNDGKRDLPDVSLFASNGFVDNAYAMCEADITFPCNANNLVQIGGTSASSPAFAGLMAMVDQGAGTREGNPNFVFYKLAQKQAGTNCNSSSGPASTCVFNDVTSGTIAMPCANGSVNCTTAVSTDQYGVLSGYSAATGYDLATGLGSVNANNLVKDWSMVKFTPSFTTLTMNGGSAVNVVHGSSINVSVSVTPTSPQPTGDVSLIATQGNNSFGFNTMTLANGTAAGSTNMLPGGSSYTVKAHYEGDINYGGSDSNAVTVTVTPESSATALRIVTFDPTSGQIINPNATSFVYGSSYLLRADVTNSSGNDCFTAGATSASYACPTGNMAITDNGTALASGGFGLNSEGYTEDQSVQLTGGTHALAANYSGDSSYKASSGTDAVTVTPAPTTSMFMCNPQTVTIGSFIDVCLMTQSQSNGVQPTGTYSLADGTTQLSSTLTITGGSSGSPTRGAYAVGQGQVTASGPPGSHTITATYSGDSNYASSKAPGFTVTELYATTMSIIATPPNVIYGAGTAVTVTATVSTGNPASNPALKPTGTFVTFYNGPITTTATQDSNGNWILQGTFTFTPQQSTAFQVNYSGDSNYAGSVSTMDVTVTVPDFSVSAGAAPLAITAGQTGTATVTITPVTNYTSTVQLSCPNSFPGASCSISPSSVTLTNSTAATATITITTTAPSSMNSARILPLERRWMLFPISRGEWWSLSLLAGLAALLLILLPRGEKTRRGAWGFGMACVLSFMMGCGGGANASGGGGAGPYSTTTRITASSTKIDLGSGLTGSATVTSSGPTPTGNVLFEFANCQYGPTVALQNGTAAFQVPGSYLYPGTCSITAQYEGDGNNLSSTSGAVNVTITGSTGQQVVGQTSTLTHTAQVNITLQ